MSILSTEGPASSRTFTQEQMETAIMSMPTSERMVVRQAIRVIDEKTGIGYLASMDFVANLGLFFSRIAPNSSSPS